MKTIIMTGGTSGLGEIAAHAIAQAPNTRLIIGARRSAAGNVETIPLDLNSSRQRPRIRAGRHREARRY